MSTLGDDILREKEASFEAYAQKRLLYDELEKLFHGILSDSISGKTNSQVFDHIISTLILERAFRVMAQLPTGKVKGIDNNDLGDAKLKNLLLDKYVVPNANAQFDFLTKLRLVDIYSAVYGSFDVLIDQDVKLNGYVGPDMWLLNKRDVFDQVGAISLDDSDQVIIRTWKPVTYFKGLKPQNGFKNLDKIITSLSGKGGSKQNRDSENNSKRNEDQYPKTSPAKGLGYFEVLTRFERDRWVDICVDAENEVFRDQKNPHDDNELPVIRKYAIPLLDDAGGWGDVERGAGMQKAVNANWNLMFDGVELSNRPPVIINKDNVASISSFKPIAGAMWLGRGNIGNIAQPITLNPQGIQTFNNTHQVAKASLLNLFSTSDTTTTSQTDPGFGRTPEALKRQASRENTRDVADRFFMEQFVTKVMKKMCNLMSKKQASAIEFRMFPEEIDKIAREYPEIKDSYDQNTGKLKVPKGKGSTLYDYEIISGSTYAVDQKDQQDFLLSLLELWQKSQTPQGNTLEMKLKEQGFNFKFGELFKRIVANGGVQDWDKILEEMTEGERGDQFLQSDMQKFMSVLQQSGGQPNINSVPPIPGQEMGQPGVQAPMPQPMTPDMGGMPMAQ